MLHFRVALFGRTVGQACPRLAATDPAQCPGSVPANFSLLIEQGGPQGRHEIWVGSIGCRQASVALQAAQFGALEGTASQTLNVLVAVEC